MDSLADIYIFFSTPFRQEGYDCGKSHLCPHDGARPHDEEGGGHAGGEDDIDCNQQSRVPLSIDLFENVKGTMIVIQNYFQVGLQTRICFIAAQCSPRVLCQRVQCRRTGREGS